MIQIEEQLSQENDHWARLDRVIKWSGMSANRFAHHIGLMRSENLYQIKRGNNKISRRLSDMIIDKFPEVSLSWLFAGEGDMFTDCADRALCVPFYDQDVEQAIRDVKFADMQMDITLPIVVDGDLAMTYRGVAMGDSVPTNSIVVLKKISPSQIIFGCEYVIQTPDVSVLRVVRNSSEAGDGSTLRLVATLSDQFDDIVVQRDSVEAAYRVVAKIVINN